MAKVWVGPQAIMPPSMHDKKYLGELGSILPKGYFCNAGKLFGLMLVGGPRGLLDLDVMITNEIRKLPGILFPLASRVRHS